MSQVKRVPECRCLNCGKLLNSVTGPPQEDIPEPEEGNATVCLGCGHLMVFTEDLLLREPTDQEMYEMAGDPEILAIMEFTAKYQEWKSEREAVRDKGSAGESAAGSES